MVSSLVLPQELRSNSRTGESYVNKSPTKDKKSPLCKGGCLRQQTGGLFITNFLMNFQAAPFPQSPGQHKGTRYRLPVPTHHRTEK